MKVSELLEILKNENPDSVVKIFHITSDCASDCVKHIEFLTNISEVTITNKSVKSNPNYVWIRTDY